MIRNFKEEKIILLQITILKSYWPPAYFGITLFIKVFLLLSLAANAREVFIRNYIPLY